MLVELVKPCTQCGKCCTFPNEDREVGKCDLRHWLPQAVDRRFTGRCQFMQADNTCTIIKGALVGELEGLPVHPRGRSFVESITKGVCTLGKPGQACWVLSPEGKKAVSRKFMQQAIDRLNTMIAIDPIAMEALVDRRGPMLKSAAASKDPVLDTLTIAPPGVEGRTHTLSVLGLLNLTLRETAEEPLVTAVWEGDGPKGKLLRFELTNTEDVVWVEEKEDTDELLSKDAI